MNQVIKLTFAASVFLTSSAMAQPYGYLTPASSAKETAAAPVAQIPQPLPSETTTESLEAFVPQGLEGRVYRGVLPQLFSRNYGQPQTAAGPVPTGRRNGRRQAAGTPAARSQRSSRPRASTATSSPNEVRAFVDNAFLFDANRDRKLAAHELSSLFLVLTSNLSADESGGGINRDGSPLTADQELLRRNSVREAETMFLQMALSFDSNMDGALSSGEVSSMAGCIQQNDFSLIGAAQQNTQQRSSATPSNSQMPSQSAPMPAPVEVTPMAPK